MADQELIAFVKKWLAEGGKEKDLRAELKSAGWSEEEVNEAMTAVETGSTQTPEESTGSQQKPITKPSPQSAATYGGSGAPHSNETKDEKHTPQEVRRDSAKEPQNQPEVSIGPQFPGGESIANTAETYAMENEGEKSTEGGAQQKSPDKLRARAEKLAEDTPTLSAFKGPGSGTPQAAKGSKTPPKEESSRPAAKAQPKPSHQKHTEPTRPRPDTSPATVQAAKPEQHEPKKKTEATPPANLPTGTKEDQERLQRSTVEKPTLSLEKPAAAPTKKAARKAAAPTASSTYSGFPGPVALFSLAWERLASRFPTVLAIIVAMVAVVGLLGFATTISAGQTSPNAPWWYFISTALVVVLFIAQAWGQLALLSALQDRPEKNGAVGAFSATWRKIHSYWWISIIGGAITIGGFFLFVIPGILFAIWFSFALFVLVAEGDRGMNALLKSREYVRGRWWGVLGRFAVVIIAAMIVSGLLSGAATLVPLPYAQEFVTILVNVLVAPFIIAYGMIMYESLRTLSPLRGFTTTIGKKALYLAVGILGIILVPGSLLGTALWTLDDARSSLPQAADFTQ